MKLVMKSQGISNEQLYALVAPATYTNMRDKVGMEVTVKTFAMYDEESEIGSKHVLAIETEDEEIVVSASRSLIASFETMTVVFGKAPAKILITESASRSGNPVLDCKRVVEIAPVKVETPSTEAFLASATIKE